VTASIGQRRGQFECGLLRQSQHLVHEAAVNLLAFIAIPSLHRKLRGIVRHTFPSQSNGRSPIVHSFGGSPSAVFWYSQLPQTVQFQLLLIFVMWPGDPISLTPESLDHHAGEREMAFQPIRDRHCKAA
jgi:hypothetical protein